MQKLVDNIIDRLKPENLSYEDYDLEGTHLVALGKPAASFAKTLSKQVSFQSILCYTKEGHTIDADFEQWEGDHPLPSTRNLENTEKLIEQISSYSNITFLVTGGASSLLVKPRLAWEQFIQIWQEMLMGGWGIEEMNQIRILMSEVKGGGLLNHLNANKVTNLYISDVPKDHFSYVSSSPTNPVSLDVRKVTALIQKLPQYQSELEQLLGVNKPVIKCSVKNHLLLSGEKFLQFAQEEVQKQYPDCEILLDTDISSESLEEFMNRIPELIPGQIWLSVGEASVTVNGSGGVGGRNSHLVAVMNSELKQNESFLSLASDGNDGHSDLAGGFIRPDMIPLDELLRETNSFNTAAILAKYKLALKCPAGQNNLMDLRIKFSF